MGWGGKRAGPGRPKGSRQRKGCPTGSGRPPGLAPYIREDVAYDYRARLAIRNDAGFHAGLSNEASYPARCQAVIDELASEHEVSARLVEQCKKEHLKAIRRLEKRLRKPPRRVEFVHLPTIVEFKEHLPAIRRQEKRLRKPPRSVAVSCRSQMSDPPSQPEPNLIFFLSKLARRPMKRVYFSRTIFNGRWF
jgi:hypothetical protein